MPAKLFDLVPNRSGSAPFFFATGYCDRLLLLQKGILFETVEFTYHDLRFNEEWIEKLGKQKPIPLVELDDGTLIRESKALAIHLDKTYPNAPSGILPTASLPIDQSTKEYEAALAATAAFGKHLSAFQDVFKLMAVPLAELMSREGPDSDHHYWTGPERMGDSWPSIVATNPEVFIQNAITALVALEAILSAPGVEYFTHASAPGWSDFSVMGGVRMLQSTNKTHADRVFGGGMMGKWLQKMEAMFEEGLGEVKARDPK